MKAVQEALNAAGYNCGTPDGIAGNNTKNAILAYQAAKGLSQTGVVDDELLVSLGLREEPASGDLDTTDFTFFPPKTCFMPLTMQEWKASEHARTVLAALVISDGMDLEESLAKIDPTRPVALGFNGDNVLVMGTDAEKNCLVLLNAAPDSFSCHYTSAQFDYTPTEEDVKGVVQDIFQQANLSFTWLDPQALQDALRILDENWVDSITGNELVEAFGLERAEQPAAQQPAEQTPQSVEDHVDYHAFTPQLIPNEGLSTEEWLATDQSRAKLVVLMVTEHHIGSPHREHQPVLYALSVGQMNGLPIVVGWDDLRSTVFVMLYSAEENLIGCSEITGVDLTDEYITEYLTSKFDVCYSVDYECIQEALNTMSGSN